MEVKVDIHTSLLSSEIMYACSLQEGAKKVTYIWTRPLWQYTAVCLQTCMNFVQQIFAKAELFAFSRQGIYKGESKEVDKRTIYI